jgi:hypothetical protein
MIDLPFEPTWVLYECPHWLSYAVYKLNRNCEFYEEGKVYESDLMTRRCKFSKEINHRDCRCTERQKRLIINEYLRLFETPEEFQKLLLEKI